MIWRHLSGEFILGARPLLMGILNVTPDSFSDGGQFLLQDKALEHAGRLVGEGARIIDVGGESTRPDAIQISEEDECRRILPVIENIRRSFPGVAISVDTYKAGVAEKAVKAGASIVNDVGAGLWDEKMVDVLRANGAAYVCMHSQGRPGVMQKNPVYGNTVSEILEFLMQRKKALVAGGIAEDRLVFDVGIGFGKRLEDNLALIQKHSEFFSLERPLLWGISRKSFISKVLDVPVDQRLAGGLALHALLLREPFPQIWRVHDVAEHAQLIKMLEAVRGGQPD